MKVLLLAAGRSKRMKPIEDKNFLNFLGKPLIQHQLELLHKTEFDDVLVVGGAHNLDKIKELGENLKMKIEICEQKNLELGMCGAVLSAKNMLGNGPILIFSSNDIVSEKAFELVKKAYDSNGADSYILAKKVSEYFPGGYLEIGSDGFIQNIIEKPEPGKEPSNLINLVVHIHKNPATLVKYLEKTESKNDDRYELALSAMMRDGIKFKAIEYDGFWQPIKFPWHVHKVFEYLFNQADKKMSKPAKISETAVIKGDVIFGENVTVFDGAVINGPAYIGDNSIVATNALVRNSNVGKDCVIGFSTEVARSYLGNNVWTHSNYIGDSVIGDNVSFGAGTVTGNLRLDEKNVCVDCDGEKVDMGSEKFGVVIGNNVRCGINVSLMPGVKIGSGSFIGAGVCLGENIPENSFVRGKWELKISENKENAGGDREKFKNKL